MKVTHKHNGGFGLVLSKTEAAKLGQLIRVGRSQLVKENVRYNADFAAVMAHLLPNANQQKAEENFH